MYDPHSLLEYLFDECGLKIEAQEIQKYWRSASDRNCPWAVNEPGDRIPVKIFGDDCVYDERLNKAYALVLSLLLWRPKSARCSRFLIWTQKSAEFVGFAGMQPVLARMVWSLNLLYETGLPKTGHRFAVCEIGGDWAWNRLFWQLERHWNSMTPCPFCDVRKFGQLGYAELPDLPWLSTLQFVNMVGSGGSRRVNPLVLLRNFDVSLVHPCQLHNLNLGLLLTSNGGAIATFAELGFFGDPTESLAVVLENAWDDFVLFMKQEGLHCSQGKFTIKMIFKSAHGAYFSAKGYNSRILADWLADCASSAWESRLGEQGRPFGVWLLNRPDQLRRAQQDEQMAPLCFALPLSVACFSHCRPKSVVEIYKMHFHRVQGLDHSFSPFAQLFLLARRTPKSKLKSKHRHVAFVAQDFNISLPVSE